MNDISTNIKKVMIIFLLCFLALISYLTYFEIFKAPAISLKPENRRLWVKRNEVLRGTIFDKNGIPLTKSTKIDQESQKREYTGGAMFSHVLGYEDIRYGLTGLEKKYDSELMADDSSVNAYLSLLKGEKEDKVGHNLKTTLDYNLQKQAFELLGDNRGAVVALNPRTGEILAMVSKPSYDPNDLKSLMDIIKVSDKNSDIIKNSPLLNRATSGLYPPGSTFKTVTAIAALENISGIMTKKIQDTGKLVFNAKESMSNDEGEVLGNINFQQAYVMSSNVYFGQLGLDMGNDKLKAVAEKLFFNKNVPSDGITIENSRFPTYKSYEKGNIAQSAIGQSSVLASPMEMAIITSAIANDGVSMMPYVVKEVWDSKGVLVKAIEPKSNGTVMSKDISKTMKDFMRLVVKQGTGTSAALSGIEVCGKTGTAENQNSAGVKQLPHSWFIGFAPYDNPQIAVAVIVENGGYGAGKAATIASQIMKSGLKK
jgi:peptidoglycan glycosyltransferase